MSHECVSCGATEFAETDDGALTCVECGMQLHGVRAEVSDLGPQVGSLKRVKTVPRVRMGGSEVGAHGLVTTTMAFEAFQHVLQAYLSALVDPNGPCAMLASAQLLSGPASVL